MQDELQQLRAHTQCTVLMVTHDVEEALFLSDRVVVMDSRPGRIRTILSPPAAARHDRTSAAFAEAKARLLRELLDEPGSAEVRHLDTRRHP